VTEAPPQRRSLLAPPEPLVVGEGEVHVVFARVSQLSARLGELESLLSPAEKDRSFRFYFRADRYRHIVSHAAVRLCVAAALSRPPQMVSLAAAVHGKPYLPPAPGPSWLRFNLSHSGDLALCALSRGIEVGVDVEQVRSDLDWEQLARHTFRPPEVQSILAFAPAERRRAFYRMWTCKEAVVKARGDGLSLPLDLFEVLLEGPRVKLTTSRMPEGPGQYALSELEVDDVHHGAVVTLSPAHRVITWDLTLDGGCRPRSSSG
jgi:4'-phosphopantetheinyl transferase